MASDTCCFWKFKALSLLSGRLWHAKSFQFHSKLIETFETYESSFDFLFSILIELNML